VRWQGYRHAHRRRADDALGVRQIDAEVILGKDVVPSYTVQFDPIGCLENAGIRPGMASDFEHKSRQINWLGG